MKLDFEKLSKEDSHKIRQNFIDRFVDTSHDLFVKYIRDAKADDIWEGYGHIASYLFACLKNSVSHKEYTSKAFEYLNGFNKNDTLFVMFDVRPAKRIYPDGCRSIAEPYTKYFDSDTVLRIYADKLYDILIHDYKCTVAENLIFGEDLYVFEPSMKWYIAFTHNYFVDEQGRECGQYCYTNITL